MSEKSPFRPCGRDPVEFFNSTGWAFPGKLIEDERRRRAAYRLLFARRFPKRALSSRRRAVRERVTNRLAPIATLALPSHKRSFVRHDKIARLYFGAGDSTAAMKTCPLLCH